MIDSTDESADNSTKVNSLFSMSHSGGINTSAKGVNFGVSSSVVDELINNPEEDVNEHNYEFSVK